MAFWWRRRRKYWRGRRRPFYRKRYSKYKRRRRFYRRKPKRTYRRRRKRRTKVRRKKQTIPLKQWQPDTIRKCKVKGLALHVLGSNGKQFACYTDNRFSWTPPTTPGGGGFGVEKFTLQYLYKEYLRGNNIWTYSNVYLDLVRYTGATINFYRHPHIDFVVYYRRMYPMAIDKYSYAESHPFNLLKQKHKIIIPSFRHKPYGKRRVKVKFKPPKQLVTKWFFQEGFAETGLIQLTSSACDLNYSYIGSSNSNQLLTIYALNQQFYKNAGWGNATHISTYGWYNPTGNLQGGTWTGFDINGKPLTANITSGPNKYMESTNYNTGWFQTNLLKMAKITTPQQVIPTTAGRYNPTRDDGQGNALWLVNVVKDTYAPPSTDKTLIVDSLPLWQLAYGFFDYVQKVKQDTTFLKSYYCVLQSPYIEPHSGLNKSYIPIDQSFINGKGPYGEYVTENMKQHWYVTLEHQLETINQIVQSGPYIPKLENQKLSTWELHSSYTFFFKFGGAELPEQETADPSKQGQYDVPDKFKSAIQISDPKYQKAKHMLHAWDFRRGILTKRAYKRILENQSTSSIIQTDSEEETPKKKKKFQGNEVPIIHQTEEKIQDCLLSLCERSTSQEEETTTDIKQLIKQQRKKQQQLKLNMLHIISELKKKQTLLQLQTGLLE
nr:MAG: ORF1 [Torque teno midi virus]